MKQMRMWLLALMLVMGLHTSALAGEVWMDEERITNLNNVVSFMSSDAVYESSDPSVATVTQYGTVHFHKEGSVVITMKQDGLTLHQPYRVEREIIDTSAFSREIVRLVNEERARYGLRPVQEDVHYQACADIRAEEITRYYSHTRPDGRHCDTVMEDYGVRHPYMGENIAMGQDTPAQVMASWMSSDGHRANILRSEFNYLAAACHQGADGALYWVQIFTKR